MKYDNVTILAMVAIVCSVIVFGIVWYHNILYNKTLKQELLKNNTNVEMVCENTSRFVDMCYQEGLKGDGDFIHLYDILAEAANTNEELFFIGKLCENSYLMGATDRQNGKSRNIRTNVKNECVSFYNRTL